MADAFQPAARYRYDFLQIEGTSVEEALQVIENHQPAIIGIVTYESPTILQAIIDLNVHGMISKPLRPLGILTQFALARYRHGYERRLAGKVQKLEETMKGPAPGGKGNCRTERHEWP